MTFTTHPGGVYAQTFGVVKGQNFFRISGEDFSHLWFSNTSGIVADVRQVCLGLSATRQVQASRACLRLHRTIHPKQRPLELSRLNASGRFLRIFCTCIKHVQESP